MHLVEMFQNKLKISNVYFEPVFENILFSFFMRLLAKANRCIFMCHFLCMMPHIIKIMCCGLH